MYFSLLHILLCPVCLLLTWPLLSGRQVHYAARHIFLLKVSKQTTTPLCVGLSAALIIHGVTVHLSASACVKYESIQKQ